MDSTTEFLKEHIRKLISQTLNRPIGQVDYSLIDLKSVTDLYKHQLERLGFTDVTVTASLPATHDTVELQCRFTPPPAPIEISFTVEPAQEQP